MKTIIPEQIDQLEFEKKLYEKNITLIAGIDEVGRGPLCGPVVACACILPVNYQLKGLNDSKKISEKRREELYEILIKEAVSYGIGIVDEKRIDEINIREASREAMEIAVKNLNIKPEHLLIDAMNINIDLPQDNIIKGDIRSLSISAASVIAKVTRDRMMYELDKEYPEYGFKKHKGYPTKEHLTNLQKFGILSNYRFTYRPVSDLINSGVEIHEIHPKK